MTGQERLPCKLWTGVIGSNGYGHTSDAQLAHRVLWEEVYGPIPDGLELDHLCHGWDKSCPGGGVCMHRRCVELTHLEPVTHRENGLRGRSFCAANAAKTHCVNGHPFDEANTYYRPDRPGQRQCRACNREGARRYAQRKRSVNP